MYQYPATPTPLPPFATPAIDLGSVGEFGLWESTDDAIQMWQIYPTAGTVLQVIFIVVLAYIIIRVIISLLGMTESDNEGTPQKVNVSVQQPRRPMFRGASRRRRR